MKQKGNLWFADWRDEHGKRHRKGFANKSTAQRFQNRMRETVEHAKKERARATPKDSSRPGQPAASGSTAKQRSRSSLLRDTKARTNSHKPTRTKRPS